MSVIENGIKAIDEVAKKAVAEYSYKNTEICTIVSRIKDTATYWVTTGTIKFQATAIDEKTIYAVNSKVFVLIPNSDYSGDKLILGLQETTEKQPLGYVTDSSNFVELQAIDGRDPDWTEWTVINYHSEEFQNLYLLPYNAGMDCLKIDYSLDTISHLNDKEPIEFTVSFGLTSTKVTEIKSSSLFCNVNALTHNQIFSCILPVDEPEKFNSFYAAVNGPEGIELKVFAPKRGYSSIEKAGTSRVLLREGEELSYTTGSAANRVLYPLHITDTYVTFKDEVRWFQYLPGMADFGIEQNDLAAALRGETYNWVEITGAPILNTNSDYCSFKALFKNTAFSQNITFRNSDRIEQTAVTTEEDYFITVKEYFHCYTPFGDVTDDYKHTIYTAEVKNAKGDNIKSVEWMLPELLSPTGSREEPVISFQLRNGFYGKDTDFITCRVNDKIIKCPVRFGYAPEEDSDYAFNVHYQERDRIGISMEEEENEIALITVVEAKDGTIPDTYEVTWEFINENYYEIVPDSDSGNIGLLIVPSWGFNRTTNCSIIKCTAKIPIGKDNSSLFLTRYFPVVTFSSFSHGDFTGTRQVIYHSVSTEAPAYDKRMYSFADELDITATLLTNIVTNDVIRYNSLVPFGIPTSKSSCVLLEHKVERDGNIDFWVNIPILHTQVKTEYEKLNQWDGQLTIDEKNATIISSALAAGKVTDNGFSGFVGGLLDKFDADSNLTTSATGIYMFKNGVTCFEVNENGSFYLGNGKDSYLKLDNGQMLLKQNQIDIRSDYITISDIKGQTGKTEFEIKTTGALKVKLNTDTQLIELGNWYLHNECLVSPNPYKQGTKEWNDNQSYVLIGNHEKKADQFLLVNNYDEKTNKSTQPFLVSRSGILTAISANLVSANLKEGVSFKFYNETTGRDEEAGSIGLETDQYGGTFYKLKANRAFYIENTVGLVQVTAAHVALQETNESENYLSLSNGNTSLSTATATVNASDAIYIDAGDSMFLCAQGAGRIGNDKTGFYHNGRRIIGIDTNTNIMIGSGGVNNTYSIGLWGSYMLQPCKNGLLSQELLDQGYVYIVGQPI